MAGPERASQTPKGLVPVPVPARGPSGRIALGAALVVLAAIVGIALVGQAGGGGRGSEVALGAATASAPSVPMASPTASPTPMLVATPLPTAPLTPPGTPPPRVSPSLGPLHTCPPGSTPDTPGPVDQARPSDPSPAMAFDRQAAKLVALAGSDAGPDIVETWTFDVCANTWTQMHPNREPPAGTGQLVYDVDSDVTISSDSTRMWVYDLKFDTWTEKGPFAPFAPSGQPLFASLQFYDPVSGRVVALGPSEGSNTPDLALWSYAVESDTWAEIRQANRPGIGTRFHAFAYDASIDRLVAYAEGGSPGGANQTWLFDLRTGTWSTTGAVAPEWSYGWWGIGPAIAYDEAAERTVMVGQGHSAAYDASADRWETLYEAPPGDQPGACGTRPECRMGRGLVYDPVNQRLVAYGGSHSTMCTWEAADDMLAFDRATRTWTLVLLATPVSPPLQDLAARGASASTDPDRSSWIRAAKVTLHGGPFFTRIPGVADEPGSSMPHAPAASVADGRFLPECQLWTEGTVWWEETTSEPSSRAWIEIDLEGTFVLDAAVVQADVNDEYRLSYRDPKTGKWLPLWDIPLGEAGGMATRPQQGDASVRWPLAPAVLTDALRFEATSGDAQYSVSEIAVFGKRVP